MVIRVRGDPCLVLVQGDGVVAFCTPLGLPRVPAPLELVIRSARGPRRGARFGIYGPTRIRMVLTNQFQVPGTCLPCCPAIRRTTTPGGSGGPQNCPPPAALQWVDKGPSK